MPFTYEPVKVPALRCGPLRGGFADPDSLSVSGPFCSTPVWQNAPYAALLQPNSGTENRVKAVALTVRADDIQ